MVVVSCASGDTEVGLSVLKSDEAAGTAGFEVSLVPVLGDPVTDGDSVLNIEDTEVPVMSDSSVKKPVPSPEPSVFVGKSIDAVSGLKVDALIEGTDSTTVGALLMSSSTTS